MTPLSPQAPPGDTQAYPPLPGAGVCALAEGGQAEHVCFEFPGRRVYCRRWCNLRGAQRREESGQRTIKFHFFELAATLTFEGDDPSLFQSCWQAYLDGRLTAVEHQPGLCHLLIECDDLTVDFDHVYPCHGGGKTKRQTRKTDDFP